jgi:putative oxidoreductase
MGKRMDWLLLWLRLGVGGLLFGVHGTARLVAVWNHLIGGRTWGFIDVVARMGFPAPGLFAVLSALTEALGALLIIAGWWTRPAAALLAINLMVALRLKLSQGGKEAELPAIYLIGIIAILIAGAGEFSLSARLRRRSPGRKR